MIVFRTKGGFFVLDYVIKRLLQVVLVIFLALIAVFFLIRLSGDLTTHFLPPDAAGEQIEEYKELLGFNRPLYEQYFDFMGDAVRGDFGQSLRSQDDALQLVIDRLPATFQLAISALVLSLIVAIPLGVLSAHKRNTMFDRVGVAFSVAGQAIPGFWLGLILIYIFAAKLKILPSSGGGSIAYMILSTITLEAYSVAPFTRFS